MRLRRRDVLLGSAALAIGAVAFGVRARRRSDLLLSAYEDAAGDQFVGGVSLESGHVFGARVPMRAHGCAVDPTDVDRVVFFARRPGTQAFVLRRGTLECHVAFETPAGRHLAGHGLFSPDGRWLYSTEHDYERPRGVIAVRDAKSFRIVDELATHGLDPHELAWTAGGDLLVANGGILTHPRTYRQKLNLPTMDPSLCLLSPAGQLREQWRLADHRLSIRHLSVAPGGGAAVGLQFEGDPAGAPGVVAIYEAGTGLRLLDAPASELQRTRGYVASVAIDADADLVVAACPLGGGLACWGWRDRRYLGFVDAGEAYGLARSRDGLLASRRDGGALLLGDRRLDVQPIAIQGSDGIRWDDHWTNVG